MNGVSSFWLEAIVTTALHVKTNVRAEALWVYDCSSLLLRQKTAKNFESYLVV